MNVLCPVHKRVVAAHPDGKLAGVCDQCARECADAIRDVAQGVAAANFWAAKTLAKYQGTAA